MTVVMHVGWDFDGTLQLSIAPRIHTTGPEPSSRFVVRKGPRPSRLLQETSYGTPLVASPGMKDLRCVSTGVS